MSEETTCITFAYLAFLPPVQMEDAMLAILKQTGVDIRKKAHFFGQGPCFKLSLIDHLPVFISLLLLQIQHYDGFVHVHTVT